MQLYKNVMKPFIKYDASLQSKIQQYIKIELK